MSSLLYLQKFWIYALFYFLLIENRKNQKICFFFLLYKFLNLWRYRKIGGKAAYKSSLIHRKSGCFVFRTDNVMNMFQKICIFSYTCF